jgi:hypothetical protein
VENNLSRYASCLHESVYTLYVFFLWSLLSGVGLWIWFGLVWFFFVWMGKDFVLELLCVRVSFPSVARHMTAACIRSSRANVPGFFRRGGIHVGRGLVCCRLRDLVSRSGLVVFCGVVFSRIHV